LPTDAAALTDACAHAAILISAVPVANCSGPKLVLDSETIAREGGYAIRNGEALSVRDWRGQRPWNP
jgi:hypothetical protein